MARFNFVIVGLPPSNVLPVGILKADLAANPYFIDINRLLFDSHQGILKRLSIHDSMDIALYTPSRLPMEPFDTLLQRANDFVKAPNSKPIVPVEKIGSSLAMNSSLLHLIVAAPQATDMGAIYNSALAKAFGEGKATGEAFHWPSRL